jgi:hypothetical protein
VLLPCQTWCRVVLYIATKVRRNLRASSLHHLHAHISEIGHLSALPTLPWLYPLALSFEFLDHSSGSSAGAVVLRGAGTTRGSSRVIQIGSREHARYGQHFHYHLDIPPRRPRFDSRSLHGLVKVVLGWVFSKKTSVSPANFHSTNSALFTDHPTLHSLTESLNNQLKHHVRVLCAGLHYGLEAHTQKLVRACSGWNRPHSRVREVAGEARRIQHTVNLR